MINSITGPMVVFWFLSVGVTFAPHDSGYSVVQAADGGYVFLGYSNSYTYGGFDFLLYKLSSSGNKMWRKNYGGNWDDRGYNIQKTSDGGYLIAGESYSYTNGSSDFLVYKLSSNGNKEWRKHFGGPQFERAHSCGETADGGYFVFGASSSYSYGSDDFLLYKLDSDGNKVWRRHFGGANSDYGTVALNLPSDGGYLLLGQSESYTFGQRDFLIYRLDSNGNKMWRKHFGGSLDDGVWDLRPGGNCLVQTADGGFAFSGFSLSYTNGSWDILVYKIDSAGNKIWRKNFGGTMIDQAYAIQQISDSGFVVAGYSISYTHGSNDFIIYRLNSAGNKVWRRHYGGTDLDRAFCILQSTEGGFAVSGYTYSYVYTPEYPDFLLYKLDSSGNKVWRKHYGK